jgi:TolB-like protein
VPLKPGQSLSRYRLLEVIGEGGMGVVWKALDTTLERPVAVKILPEEFAADRNRAARFMREAKLLASLNHPHIATIHEVGQEDEILFLAMEMVEGSTLREILRKGPLPLGDALRIGAEIVEALVSAHEARVVHRDLKPDNVIVRADGHAKILDFGLAKLMRPEGGPASDKSQQQTVSGERTEEGAIVGTTAYMSPEQIRGEEIDGRSDIFSFGILLYEMVTGRPAFKGRTRIDTLAAILEAKPVPASTRSAQGTPDLDLLVSRCLEKEAADRYQDAAALLSDIREVRRAMESEAGTPVTGASLAAAAGPSRPRRPSWKHRLVLAGVAAALVTGFFLLPSQLNPPEKDEEPGIATDVPRGNRIVVLPFQNLGPAEDIYFAEGMAEEITGRLATVGDLKVIARSSAAGYSGKDPDIQRIRAELGVDYILQGTVRWASSGGSGRMRITPKLIDTADESVVWAGIFDKSTEDVFAVQSSIAGTVIEHLGVALGDTELRAVEARPTANLEAYQAYLQGIYRARKPVFTRENRIQAVRDLQRAVDLDPEFVLAHVELSRALSFLHLMGIDASETGQRAARQAAERAAALAPDAPEPHLAMGYYLYHVEKAYSEALEEFAVARAGLPGNDEVIAAIAFVHRRQGRFEEAVQGLRAALDLNPRGANLAAQVGETLRYLRRSGEAERYLNQSVAMAPDQTFAYQVLVPTYWLAVDSLGEARTALESLSAEDDSVNIWFWFRQLIYEGDYPAALSLARDSGSEVSEWSVYSYPTAFLAGLAHDLLGNPEAARAAYLTSLAWLEKKIVERPEDPRLHSSLGLTFAALGRKDEAIREGQRAVDLYPLSYDAYFGPWYLLDLAWIFVMVGDLDAAFDELDRLLTIPSHFSMSLFELDPRWAPLRDHPRFGQLVERFGSQE